MADANDRDPLRLTDRALAGPQRNASALPSNEERANPLGVGAHQPETASLLLISVNGNELRVEPGLTLAAALWNAGVPHLRRSVSGEPRAPLCAMGICYECRVTIDGLPHRRACLELCRDGMEVRTDG